MRNHDTVKPIGILLPDIHDIPLGFEGEYFFDGVRGLKESNQARGKRIDESRLFFR
jgi:hypothetical protein